MKIKHIVVGLMFMCGATVNAQESDSLGTIGDNLDLYAVMDAFEQAESIEAFENALNDPKNKINNLDLNEDGDVDYISVIDNVSEDAHAIILRIELSESESQDVAVFEIEKIDKDIANIQLVGDEDLYGEDYIVEPSEAISTGQSPPVFIVVNVWHWPSVKFIYGVRYKPWVSPYGWHRHPQNWKPWKPYKWHTYHGFHKGHHHKYHVVHVHRTHNAHKIYHNHRKSWKHIKNHSQHHHHKNGNKNHSGKKGNNGHKKGNKGNKANKGQGGKKGNNGQKKGSGNKRN